MNSPATDTVSDESVRAMFEDAWGMKLQGEPGLRIPNMFEAALDGDFKGLYIEGRGYCEIGSEHPARHRGAHLDGVHLVQDCS